MQKDPCVDPSMTLHAAVDEMRANGLSIQEAAFTRLINSGHLPFAWGCPPEKPGQKSVLLISTHLFRKWLGEYLGHEPIELSRI